MDGPGPCRDHRLVGVRAVNEVSASRTQKGGGKWFNILPAEEERSSLMAEFSVVHVSVALVHCTTRTQCTNLEISLKRVRRPPVYGRTLLLL